MTRHDVFRKAAVILLIGVIIGAMFGIAKLANDYNISKGSVEQDDLFIANMTIFTRSANFTIDFNKDSTFDSTEKLNFNFTSTYDIMQSFNTDTTLEIYGWTIAPDVANSYDLTDSLDYIRFVNTELAIDSADMKMIWYNKQ